MYEQHIYTHIHMNSYVSEWQQRMARLTGSFPQR